MRTFRHIQFGDRQKIKDLFMQGRKPEEVAAELGFNIAAIYRELKRCAADGERSIEPANYDPHVAQADADRKRGRKGTQSDQKSEAAQTMRLLRRNAKLMKKVCDECLDVLEKGNFK